MIETKSPAPIGVISKYKGNIEPRGWFICEGGELSRTEHVALFEIIGTTYGEGDGSITFTLPNFGGVTSERFYIKGE